MRKLVGTTAKASAGFWNEIARMASPEAPPPERPAPTRPEPTPSPVRAAPPTDRPAQVQESPPVDDQSPDGVLVPLDTWTRVMDQLGNLHEAGQQLAEARERAARAETQVEFLKSQLAETRAKLADPPGGSGPGGTAAGPEPTPEPAPAPRSAPASPPATGRAAPQPGAGGRLSSARNRLGAWLSTD